MVKKISFHLILFSFLFYSKAFASDEGMPQLNPEFWISQIFWLTLVFGFLYLLLSKLILPKISDNLEARKSEIAENIEAAEKQRNESDQKLKDYEKIISQSKTEAKNLFSQAETNGFAINDKLLNQQCLRSSRPARQIIRPGVWKELYSSAGGHPTSHQCQCPDPGESL